MRLVIQTFNKNDLLAYASGPHSPLNGQESQEPTTQNTNTMPFCNDLIAASGASTIIAENDAYAAAASSVKLTSTHYPAAMTHSARL